MRVKQYLEKEIEQNVYQYAEKLGVLHYKFKSPSCRSVPDRIFMFNSLVYFVEFKSKNGKLDTSQKIKIADIRAQNIPVFVINNIQDGIKLIDELIIAGTNKRGIK